MSSLCSSASEEHLRGAPDHAASIDDPVVVDLDATLLTAHSEKEQAAPTFKRGFGFHPLLSFVDHGQDGTGEPLAFLLRKGNAGSNTAADHIAVTRAAFAQLPGNRPGRRPGKRVLVRTDGAGCTHTFLDWLTSQRVQYSIGFTLPSDFAAQVAVLDKAGAWEAAPCRHGRSPSFAELVALEGTYVRCHLHQGWDATAPSLSRCSSTASRRNSAQ